jgi:hypothetical protein
MDSAESELVVVKRQVEAAITLLDTMPFPPSPTLVLITEKVVKDARLHNRTALLHLQRAAAGEPACKKSRLQGEEGGANV